MTTHGSPHSADSSLRSKHGFFVKTVDQTRLQLTVATNSYVTLNVYCGKLPRFFVSHLVLCRHERDHKIRSPHPQWDIASVPPWASQDCEAWKLPVVRGAFFCLTDMTHHGCRLDLQDLLPPHRLSHISDTPTKNQPNSREISCNALTSLRLIL